MSATRFECSPLAVIVKPRGDGILSDKATSVSIESEGDGHYVAVWQPVGGRIGITPEEWPDVKRAICSLLYFCTQMDKQEESHE